MDTSRVGTLEQQAQSLVQRLAIGCQNGDLGSATVTIYDTAWVSMVSKNDSGEESWLFPECFQYVLENQLPNGGWQCYSTRDDGLLNTLAALLALRKHANRSDIRCCPNTPDLEGRISKATIYLQESLQHWDVDESPNVGFELLIPALLSMLERENIHFAFPGRIKLDRLNKRKLARFDLEMIYRNPTTFLHSLEAFIDQIDFDRLRCHKIGGSMMASPASTAAYLVHSSTWDTEAEFYLRKTLREGPGKNTGAVPSVFPMPVFEVSWILSTLLQSGFSDQVLGKENIDTILVYLTNHLQNQHGLLGFGGALSCTLFPYAMRFADLSITAPLMLPDADDTAKTLLTINLLGKAAKPDHMIQHFRSESGHFQTYPGETDASFSANCNVLIALTHMPNVEEYGSCIESISMFLSEAWWSGTHRDKWNNSQQYSTMLLAQALTRVLVVWDDGLLKTLPEAFIRDRVTLILVQILNRTLLTQKTDGAWSPERCLEVTAYGVLTLKALQSLPWHMSLQEAVASGVRSGQEYLDQSPDEWAKPAYVWVEKVTYGSARLSEAYCLAAMKVSGTSYDWSDHMQSLFKIPEKPLSKLLQLFMTLRDFQNEARWKLVASALEGYIFLPQLKSAGSKILPEQKGAKNEYLAYIPFTWILVNNCNHLFLSANLLWDMMILTVCNFRVDEYMESAVGKLSDASLEPVKAMISYLCSARESNNLGTNAEPFEHQLTVTFDVVHPSPTNEVAINGRWDRANGTRSDTTEDSKTGVHEQYSVSTLTSVRSVLSHYTQAMLNYSRILGASKRDSFNFRNALCAFLLSHIAQIADNSSFATQPFWNSATTSIFANTRQTFFNWARTTGAESVSCPFSFAFLTCLLGAASASPRNGSHNPASDCFGSARQSYLAQDLCMHLAIMSRLYNDFGSVERDRIEANVNSVNFPEFHRHMSDVAESTEKAAAAAEYEIRLKKDLLELAQLERQSADIAAERLLKELEASGEPEGGERKKKEKADAVRLFIGVTRLYADLYVARDLSNRVTA